MSHLLRATFPTHITPRIIIVITRYTMTCYLDRHNRVPGCSSDAVVRLHTGSHSFPFYKDQCMSLCQPGRATSSVTLARHRATSPELRQPRLHPRTTHWGCCLQMYRRRKYRGSGGQIVGFGESGSEDALWLTFSSGLVLKQITSERTRREYRRVRAGQLTKYSGNNMYHWY